MFYNSGQIGKDYLALKEGMVLKWLQLLNLLSWAFSRHTVAFPHYIYCSGVFSGGFSHILWKSNNFTNYCIISTF